MLPLGAAIATRTEIRMASTENRYFEIVLGGRWDFGTSAVLLLANGDGYDFFRVPEKLSDFSASLKFQEFSFGRENE